MHDLGEPGQRRGPEGLDLGAHAGELVTRRLDESAVRGVRNSLQQNQIAKTFQQVDGEPSRIVPGVDHLLHRAEQCRTVGVGESVDRGVDQRHVGDAEQRQCAFVGDTLVVGAGQQLIEDRQRVTRRTATRTDDERVHLGRDGHALALTDRLQEPAHDRRREQPERVVVGARPDGRQHLLGFGGREHEDQMLRRLFDDLQERVESRVRHHVRLVDDEHAVARLGGRIEGAVAQLAGVVDTAVTRGVELDDVEVARAARRERHTGDARSARCGGGALHTVQRTSQDPRRRRLATTARTGEEIRVIDATGIQGTAQRIGDVLLPHDVGEGSRAIGAIQSHASRLPATRDSR